MPRSKKNGHLEFPHEIAEALARVQLAGNEYRVLWVIWRKTWGWHKKDDQISLSQFQAATWLRKPHIIRALQALEVRKIINVTKIGNKFDSNTYCFNNHYEQWEVTKNGNNLDTKVEEKEVTKIGKSTRKVTKIGNEKLPKMGHTKDTNTKINNIDIIYKHWNSVNIIVHKKLTEDVKKAITKRLKEYSVEELCSVISNYAEILNGQEYGLWTYKWTLFEFMSRAGAIDKFIDLEVAKNKYRGNRNDGQRNGTGVGSTQTSQGKTQRGQVRDYSTYNQGE